MEPVLTDPDRRPDPARPDRRPGPAAPDDERTPLDDVARRLGFRDRLRANPALNLGYRVGVAVVGTAIVLLGLFLVPLPGPGWLVVFVGLGILATEFIWAERLLEFAKARIRGWTRWVRRQSRLVRGLLGLATLALLGGLAWGYLAWQGVPFVAD